MHELYTGKRGKETAQHAIQNRERQNVRTPPQERDSLSFTFKSRPGDCRSFSAVPCTQPVVPGGGGAPFGAALLGYAVLSTTSSGLGSSAAIRVRAFDGLLPPVLVAQPVRVCILRAACYLALLYQLPAVLDAKPPRVRVGSAPVFPARCRPFAAVLDAQAAGIRVGGAAIVTASAVPTVLVAQSFRKRVGSAALHFTDAVGAVLVAQPANLCGNIRSSTGKVCTCQ